MAGYGWPGDIAVAGYGRPGDIAVADYGWPGGHRCGGQKIEDAAARAASLKVSR